MAATRIAHDDETRVTVGVDTHKDTHVARAKDQLGRRVGEKTIPTTPAGYTDLLAWARGLGAVETFGLEGTGSYGAGLARYLRRHGQVVVEVIRPNRQARRRNGKSDPADADAAASAVLAGDAAGPPKAGDGAVEMVRALRVARSTAIKARTQAANAMKALVVTAPDQLRESLRDLSKTELVRTCARCRPGELTGPTAATKTALRSLAARYEALEAEITALDDQIEPVIAKYAPELIGLFGVGSDSAGVLLVAAGDNPERLRSEAAFSMLCGSSPVEASSGKVTRHRLNRGGDRQANAALYRIVLVRLRHHEATKNYMARRTTEGMSKKEIIRCLKRYVAREIYAVLCLMASDTTRSLDAA
ncbi:MAG: IS110 family transposase [Actinomycetota bacterium]|nr:IS110 family transposase [Actinomycetota bacterium]